MIICVIKQIPKRDPKFHHILILEGVGRVINELIIFKNGGSLIMGGFIFITKYSLNKILILGIKNIKSLIILKLINII